MPVYFCPCNVQAKTNDLLGIIQSSFSNGRILENLDKKYSDFIGIFINPSQNESLFINKKLLTEKSKIIVFGRLHTSTLKILQGVDLNKGYDKEEELKSAKANSTSASRLNIRYQQLEGLSISNAFDRPLKRYDYEDEWNNQGFGFIDETEIPNYSFSCNNYRQLASLFKDDLKIGDFSGVFDFNESSLLWVGSQISFFRSNEWNIIEQYISNYKSDVYPCHPYISQIPYNYDSMVTMRLDCDESIKNAEPLRKLYSSHDVPFSLAITTKLLSDEEESNYLKSVNSSGVDILSHSDTHAVDWGGSLDNAYSELLISKIKLEKLLGKSIIYAVAPFHHTPDYMFEALSKADYKGCIGGTVKRFQEHICARGIIKERYNTIFHCQQVMLHGDCMLNDADPLKVYKQSFTKALNSETIFGYLDHPFSSRYTYGWRSEEQRLEIHSKFIQFINTECPNVLWANETKTLDFINWINKIKISEDNDNYFVEPPVVESDVTAAINYKNKKYSLKNKTVLINRK